MCRTSQLLSGGKRKFLNGSFSVAREVYFLFVGIRGEAGFGLFFLPPPQTSWSHPATTKSHPLVVQQLVAFIRELLEWFNTAALGRALTTGAFFHSSASQSQSTPTLDVFAEEG